MKNLLCLVMVLGLSSLCPAVEKKPSDKIKTYEGTLMTGMAGIGGEHTGVALKTKDKTFELQLPKDLTEAAEKLNGKKVVVTGEYKPRKGVEVKERHIIEVKTLKEAK